jgi:hypothetical protein
MIPRFLLRQPGRAGDHPRQTAAGSESRDPARIFFSSRRSEFAQQERRCRPRMPSAIWPDHRFIDSSMASRPSPSELRSPLVAKCAAHK